MTIKEILDKIIVDMGADAPAETIALLVDAKRQVTVVTDSLASMNKESENRRSRIRELESELEDAKANLAKATSTDNKAELDRLREIEKKHLSAKAEADAKLKAAWAEKSKTLSVDKTSKLYPKVEKVLDRFSMPAEGKELTIEEIQQNMKAYELLELANYFNAETQITGGSPPAGKTETEVTGGSAILALSKKKLG